jgi:small basic protein
MLLFNLPPLPKTRRRYRRRVKRLSSNIQLSLFGQQLAFQFIYSPQPTIPPLGVVGLLKQEKKMNKTIISYIQAGIREGTIPLVFFGAMGICVGVMDYATMMRNLPDHFNPTIALCFGILIGIGPTLLLVLREYKSLAIVTILAAIDIALGGVEGYPIAVWIYFACQVSYLSWKINVYIAKSQGDENGRPVELSFWQNLKQLG